MKFQCKEDMYVVGYDDNDDGGGNNDPSSSSFFILLSQFFTESTVFYPKKKLIVIFFFLKRAWILNVNTYLHIIHVGLAMFGFWNTGVM